MRIALLEDDEEQADLIKLWLEKAGHSCHAVARGKDFIRKKLALSGENGWRLSSIHQYGYRLARVKTPL